MKGIAIPFLGAIIAIALLGGSIYFFGMAVKQVQVALTSFLLVILGVAMAGTSIFIAFSSKKISKWAVIVFIIGVVIAFIGMIISLFG